jgi:hypothetical protein
VRRQLQELFTTHAKEHEREAVQAIIARRAEADAEAERVRLKEFERQVRIEQKRDARLPCIVR